VGPPQTGHITVGSCPSAYAGGAVIVPLQLAQPQYLMSRLPSTSPPGAGATYLAVTNWSRPTGEHRGSA
jgi:hypothetical protein